MKPGLPQRLLALCDGGLVDDPGAGRHRLHLAVALLDDRDFHDADSLARPARRLELTINDLRLASDGLARQRRLSTATSTSQGRSVPFFLGS